MAKEYIHLDDNAVEKAAEVFKRGGVVVFPTETVYGVGVIAGNEEALAKLRRLKSRDGHKPFQFLAADLDMAQAMGAVFSDRAKRLAGAFWPGPMTMVVADASGAGTLGIRIPGSSFVLELCRRLGRPLVTSSANPAGAPPPVDAAAADAFGGEADLLIDGGHVAGGVPSTVVSATGSDFVILRQGAIGAADIESVWRK